MSFLRHYQYKRRSAGKSDFDSRRCRKLADIGAGDKSLSPERFLGDKKQIPAKAIYILSKADIAQKLSKEAEIGESAELSDARRKWISTGQVTVSAAGRQ